MRKAIIKDCFEIMIEHCVFEEFLKNKKRLEKN